MVGVVGMLHGRMVFGRRTRVLAAQLVELLPRDSVILDVGCGDGTIDSIVQQARPDLIIRGIDVLVRLDTKIPVERFDGSTFPASDKSYDAVTFIDVLHHTEDPMVLLREAKRVARHRIVIKDHTCDGLFANTRLRVMDWVGNSYHNVVLPYNYWPEKRWHAAFAELGLKPVVWRTHIGLYPFPVSGIFEAKLHFVASLQIS
jgi:SAM-dependent methyltransferase